MTQIIKLTEPVVANAGDYLLIEDQSVRVIPEHVGKLPATTQPAAAAAPAVKAGRRAANRWPRDRPAQVAARAAEIIQILTNFPGSQSPAIGTLLTEKIDSNHLTAFLHNMTQRGEIRREPAVGAHNRMSWAYFLPIKPGQ